MSVDNAIRAIAYSEAPTLGAAIALIAKHRNELDASLRAAETEQMPLTTEGAAADRALLDIAAARGANSVIEPAKSFSMGDVDTELASAAHRVTGSWWS